MFRKNSVLPRLLSLMTATVLLALCLAGCNQNTDSAPDTTTSPDATTAAPTDPVTVPTDPTDPTEPVELTGHQKLHAYLVANGTASDGSYSLTVTEDTYTFTMTAAANGSIIWEYKNEASTATMTMIEGAATHPVQLSFATYIATAEVEVSTYTNMEHKLSNFRCTAQNLADSLKAMATTAIWSCFTKAPVIMDPADVTMLSLGFTNYDN